MRTENLSTLYNITQDAAQLYCTRSYYLNENLRRIHRLPSRRASSSEKICNTVDASGHRGKTGITSDGARDSCKESCKETHFLRP